MINKSYNYLFAGLITAIGQWGAAVLMEKTSTKIVGFYQIQRTDVSEYFKQQTSKDASWENWVANIVDILHHNFTTDGVTTRTLDTLDFISYALSNCCDSSSLSRSTCYLFTKRPKF